jgi:hypothetical protein
MTNYEKVKLWRKEHPEKVKAQSRRYVLKHPETNKKAKRRYRLKHRSRILPKEAEQARLRRKNDPDGQRRRIAAFTARRELLLVATAGRPRPNVCDVCAEFNRAIVFDHCHLTHTFRGWLCDRCNKVLGIMKDSSELLRLLATYIEEHHVKINNGVAKTSPEFLIRRTESILARK